MASEGTRSAAGSRVRGLIIVGIAFAAIVAIAALQGPPEFGDVLLAGPDVLPTAEQPTAMPPQSPPPLESTEPNPWIAIIAAVIGSALALLVLYLLVRIIVRAVRQWWQDRPLRLADGAAPDAGVVAVAQPEETVEAAIVRHSIAGALDAVTAHPHPSDAITAAWIGLEESAERAGQRRGISETPAEFTIRIVGTRQSSAAFVRELLRLYESVRFGGLAATEADRERARTLLQSTLEHWR